MTAWDSFKQFIASIAIGDSFSRQQMLSAVNDKESYVDNLRNMCEKCGYIDKGHRAGVFIKIKELPDNMTVTKLRLQYERLIGSDIRKQVLQYASVVSDSL
jgi:hypothetical protein